MADREKVIRGLECHSEPHFGLDECFCETCPYDESTCGLDVPSDALKLLKAQEAKEPLIIHKDVVDEVYDYIAECPKCGMTWAMWHPEKMRYCPGCGQAVKWDEPPKEGTE